MQYKLLDNELLFQYDINRYIEVSNDINYVDFNTLRVQPSNNKVKIPNQLLASGDNIKAYFCTNEYTFIEETFIVHKRPMPSTYIHTEDQTTTFEDLVEEVETAIDGIVSPTVATTPITNGTKVTITDVDGAHVFNVMNGTGSAYDDTQIRSELASTQQSLSNLWRKYNGLSFYFDKDETEAYKKDFPSGATCGDLLKISGKSVVYNQLIGELGNTYTGATGASVELSNNNRTVTSSFQSVSSFNYNLVPNLTIVKDHIYLLTGINNFTSELGSTALRFYESGVGKILDFLVSNKTQFSTILKGLTSTTTNTGRMYLNCGINDTNVIFNATPILINLTKCFGIGNEPTDVNDERIKALEKYALENPSYNDGEIIDVNADSVRINGTNIWDEQCELGTINATTGALQNTSLSLRTKDYIEVNDYNNFIVCGNIGQQTVKTRFYDYAYNYIGSNNKNGNTILINNTFIPPKNAKYMKIAFPTEYGTTYNNDLIVAKSSSVVEYKTYVEQQIELENHNLKSVGDVYDYVNYESQKVVRRVGSVDLGTLTWNTRENVASGFFYSSVFTECKGLCFTKDYAPQARSSLWDEWGNKLISHNDGYRGSTTGNTTINSFIIKDLSLTGKTGEEVKTSLNGVYAYYELATPTEELKTEELDVFRCENNGTITFNNDYEMPVPNTIKYLVKVEGE